jgi:hypothetical protein
MASSFTIAYVNAPSAHHGVTSDDMSAEAPSMEDLLQFLYLMLSARDARGAVI